MFDLLLTSLNVVLIQVAGPEFRQPDITYIAQGLFIC